MAYNIGVAGAQKLWEQGIYETDYSKKVLKAKELIGGTQYEITVFCDQESERWKAICRGWWRANRRRVYGLLFLYMLKKPIQITEEE